MSGSQTFGKLRSVYIDRVKCAEILQILHGFYGQVMASGIRFRVMVRLTVSVRISIMICINIRILHVLLNILIIAVASSVSVILSCRHRVMVSIITYQYVL